MFNVKIHKSLSLGGVQYNNIGNLKDPVDLKKKYHNNVLRSLPTDENAVSSIQDILWKHKSSIIDKHCS